MNRTVVYSAIGTVLSGTVGFLIGKYYYQEKYRKFYSEQYEKQIDEMEEYYSHIDRYKRGNANVGKEKKSEDETKEELPSEKRLRKREELLKDSDGHIRYNRLYRANHPDEFEGPKDSDEDEEDNLEERESDEIDREHSENFHREPEFVAFDDIGDLPAWLDEQTFFYDVRTDEVMDEYDNLVHNYEPMFGTLLESDEFLDSENDRVYIRNYQTDTLYEVVKFDDVTVREVTVDD